jgi:hypothetical protein
MHPKLIRCRSAWSARPPDQELPVAEGTLIRLAGHGKIKRMRLWASEPAASPAQVTRLWQAYLRRFDIEHCFRFLKQQLGWTAPLIRGPEAADRWTWLVIAAWNQLWLARPAAAAVRLPWQPDVPAATMTPGRVRAAFRCARETDRPDHPAQKQRLASRPGNGAGQRLLKVCGYCGRSWLWRRSIIAGSVPLPGPVTRAGTGRNGMASSACCAASACSSCSRSMRIAVADEGCCPLFLPVAMSRRLRSPWPRRCRAIDSIAGLVTAAPPMALPRARAASWPSRVLSRMYW